MSNTSDNAEAKVGACSYILHMLLQRLEVSHPGLIGSLLDGAKADHSAVRAQGTISAPVEHIFTEAITLLELAHAQSKMTPLVQPTKT